MLATLTGEELVLVLGAYSALVLGAFGVLTKFVLDTRKQTTETNVSVNTCKGHDRSKGDATLRELVEKIDTRLDALEEKSSDRHDLNSRRIERVTIAVEAQTRKMDRMSDAIGGVNNRLDALEHPKGDR